jgi:hypothetical protein
MTLWAVSATTSSARLAATSHLSSIWDPPGIRVNWVTPEHHAHRAPVRRVVPYVPPGAGRLRQLKRVPLASSGVRGIERLISTGAEGVARRI